jgi:hypothetical protein
MLVGVPGLLAVSVLTALAHGAPPNLLPRGFRLQAEVLA